MKYPVHRSPAQSPPAVLPLEEDLQRAGICHGAAEAELEPEIDIALGLLEAAVDAWAMSPAGLLLGWAKCSLGLLTSGL